jgi:hypothetical protein
MVGSTVVRLIPWVMNDNLSGLSVRRVKVGFLPPEVRQTVKRQCTVD